MRSSCKAYKNNDLLNCQEDTYCVKLFKLDYLFNQALIDNLSSRAKQSLILDNIDKDNYLLLNQIENNSENFVANGENLYIHSSICGNGKSAWALRILQSYLNKIWFNSDLTCRALFISVPKYLLSIKDNISNNNSYAQHIKSNIATADLVIWDDIATKSITSFESEILFSDIDSRFLSNKSNIFTSNVETVDDLNELLGARLASRIIGYSKDILFKGPDKRGLRV